MRHLLPESQEREEAAFLFATPKKTNGGVHLEYRDWQPISPNGFAIQGPGHIELTEESQAGLIKRAHLLDTSLVEFHSHLWGSKAHFSWSDLQGLEEFVPHVMWRLKGRPYVAVIVQSSGFDALIWTDGPGNPETLSELRVGGKMLRPSGLTLSERGRHDE